MAGDLEPGARQPDPRKMGTCRDLTVFYRVPAALPAPPGNSCYHVFSARGGATLIGSSSRARVWRSCLFEGVFLAVFLFTSIVLASAQAPSAPGKPLPPGPMRAKIKATCTQCHNTGRITEQHLTRRQWSGELEKMEGLGAVIPDSERGDFLDYLSANFRPQKGAPKATAKKSASSSN
jgi:hypothetical protein